MQQEEIEAPVAESRVSNMTLDDLLHMIDQLMTLQQNIKDDLALFTREVLARMEKNDAKRLPHETLLIERERATKYVYKDEHCQRFIDHARAMNIPESEIRQAIERTEAAVQYGTRHPTIQKLANMYGGQLLEVAKDFTLEQSDWRLKVTKKKGVKEAEARAVASRP